MSTREQFAWVEKYRPQTFDDCVLPENIRHTLKGIIAQQDTQHLLFTGRAGVGKTTVAKALVNELGCDALVINASEENGIDVLRTKIKAYASSLGFDNKRKFVILDEADYLNPQSTQPALRAFMEEFAQTTCFILTCNLINRIVPPLQSRCAVIDFKIPADERQNISAAFMRRAMYVLGEEHVTYDKKLLAAVIQTYYPDFRRTLNELQRFSNSGVLSEAILSQITDKDISELFTAVKGKQFGAVRTWIAQHEDMDAASFYRMLYEQIPKRAQDDSLAELIVIMADYAYRSGFSADPQLNTLACLVEIMSTGRFK